MTNRWILGLQSSREPPKGDSVRTENSRLGIRFRIGLLSTLNRPRNNILPNIILLPQIKEAPNLRSPLRPKSLVKNRIRQPWNLALSPFNDDEGQNGNIGSYDASSDGFALTLAGAAGAVARVLVGAGAPARGLSGAAGAVAQVLAGAAGAAARAPVGEEEADARGEEDTLLHWETLFVVPACDAEDVAFPFIAERVALDLLGDFLVVEYAAQR